MGNTVSNSVIYLVTVVRLIMVIILKYMEILNYCVVYQELT